jgi:hypothetical protein
MREVKPSEGRPFSMVMNKTIFDLATETNPERRLTGLEYRVRDLMISTADDKGYVEITTTQLGKAVGTTQQKASAALVKLAKLNLLKKIENGVYQLDERMARSREMATRIRAEVEKAREQRKAGLRVI